MHLFFKTNLLIFNDWLGFCYNGAIFLIFWVWQKTRQIVTLAWSPLTVQIGTVGCKAESWRAEVVMFLCLHTNLLLCSAQQHCPPAPSSLPTLVPPGRRLFTPSPDDHNACDDYHALLPTLSHLGPSDNKNLPPSCYSLLSLLWPFSTPELFFHLPFESGRCPSQTRTTLTSWRTPWTCRPSSGSWTQDNTKSLGSMSRISGWCLTMPGCTTARHPASTSTAPSLLRCLSQRLIRSCRALDTVVGERWDRSMCIFVFVFLTRVLRQCIQFSLFNELIYDQNWVLNEKFWSDIFGIYAYSFFGEEFDQKFDATPKYV